MLNQRIEASSDPSGKIVVASRLPPREEASAAQRTTRSNAPRPAARREREPDGEGIGWASPHMLVGVGSAALIAFGWIWIEPLDLTPATGPGYALGYVGMTMLVLLLAYSVRKRVRALRHAGKLRIWFEVHLILGLLAPAVILYHANFRVESANAAIALGCLLVVAGSGVGGRFLYGRLHRGLAGELHSVAGLQRAAREALKPAQDGLARHPDVRSSLELFERRSAGLTAGLIRSLPALTLRLRSRGLRRRIAHALRARGEPRAETALVERAVRDCLGELCRAGELRLFTQLFALWHAIHIPLTVILFLSAAIHIVAVHLY